MSQIAAARVHQRRRRAGGMVPGPTVPILAYVDTVSGNDSNSGLTAVLAKRTMAAAVGVLAVGGTIKLASSAAAPLREELDYNGAPLTIEPTGASAFWYASEQHTSGWTSQPNTVWSKALSGYPTDLDVVMVTTRSDPYGLWLRLRENTGTPTTPSAGQFGWAANTLYVKLPDGSSANGHTFEIAKRTSCVKVSGLGRVTLRGLTLRCGNVGCAWANAGLVTASDCVAQYGGGNGGWVASNGPYAEMVLTRCTGEGCYNDGFNHHGSVGALNLMTLTDCIGHANKEEGASPHDDTILRVYGGEFSDNGESGIQGVGNAQMYLYDATFRRNAQLIQDATYGGISFFDATMSGEVKRCVMQTNNGPGLWIKSGAAVTLGSGADANQSGTAEGNAAPDNVAG
jgi:Right handed beta helix region